MDATCRGCLLIGRGGFGRRGDGGVACGTRGGAEPVLQWSWFLVVLALCSRLCLVLRNNNNNNKPELKTIVLLFWQKISRNRTDLGLCVLLYVVQRQSRQLFRPLLQEVDVSNWVGQSFDHIWRGNIRKDRWRHSCMWWQSSSRGHFQNTRHALFYCCSCFNVFHFSVDVKTSIQGLQLEK